MSAVAFHEQALEAFDNGRLEEAARFAALALDLFVEEDGADSPDVANVCNLLSQIAEAAGDYDSAWVYGERAWQLLQRLGEEFTGPDAESLRVEALNRLGSSLQVQGRYAEAEPWLKQALAQAEGSGVAPLVASALNNLAVLHKYTGKFDAAEGLYRRALTLVTDDSEDAATLYHNLGGLDHARGRFAAGEPNARKAWEIRSRLLGPEDPEVLADACAWAGLLDGLERYDESEPIYRKAIAAFDGLLGPDNLESAANLNSLAAVRWDRGDLVEAEELYRRAFVVKQKVLGLEHPDTALSAHNLASLLEETGRLGEALLLAEQARIVFEATLEEPHPKIDAARGLCRRLAAMVG